MQRPLQLAAFDGRDRAVGPLVQSVCSGLNADLIASIAPLYLTGSVLDVTYGRGMWWRRFTPAPFTHHDIADDGIDFRALPYESDAFDAVCFDPPYVPRHGVDHVVNERDLDFRSRFGLDESRSSSELRALISAGLQECARVTRRWLLVKCNDYVNGRTFELGHVRIVNEARELGLRPHDLIVHHSGSGPGGSQIKTALRARRAHSYLVVFAKPKSRAPRALRPKSSG